MATSVLDDNEHISLIAESMSKLDELVMDALELTYEDQQDILAHESKLDLQKKMALMKWKERKGIQATGENLAKAFVCFGLQEYADIVTRICKQSPLKIGASAAQPSTDELQTIKWTEGGETKRFHLMNMICSKWRVLGKLLHIESGELDGIASQHYNKLEDCCGAVLKKWLDNPQPEYPPTWKGLIELLEDCQLHGVVQELEDTLSKAGLS